MIRKIRNFFKWGIRGIKIRPYDYEYIFQVLQYQLTDMLEYMEKKGEILDSSDFNNMKRQMNLVLLKLNRYLADDYLKDEYEVLDIYRKAHDPEPDSPMPFYRRIEEDDGTHYVPLCMKEAQVYYGEQRKLLEQEEIQKERDIEDTLNIIKLNYQNWWI